MLYNLELAWPVVRGTTKQNEPVSIVATSPQRTAPFVEALDSMTSDINDWTAPAAPRRYIRQAIQCRARVLPEGDTQWRRGTILELSAGGCFIDGIGIGRKTANFATAIVDHAYRSNDAEAIEMAKVIATQLEKARSEEGYVSIE